MPGSPPAPSRSSTAASSRRRAARQPEMDGLFRDLRLAARGLLRAPGFTVAAVLALALGIGATSAIFSVVDGVLLRPLGYSEETKLVSLYTNFTRQNIFHVGLSVPELDDLRRETSLFESVDAYASDNMTL